MDTNVQSEKADKLGDTAQLMTLDFFIFFFCPDTMGKTQPSTLRYYKSKWMVQISVKSSLSNEA